MQESPSPSELLSLLYQDLRRLAVRKLAAEPQGATLSPTVLVHEAWIRLGEGGGTGHWQNRGHFYASAAEAMRRILIDKARRRRAIRHGGDWRRTHFDSVNTPADRDSDELFAVHEALEALAADHPRKAELVKLRYFVGLTIEEAASILEISRSSADRDWAFARAWLHRNISENR